MKTENADEISTSLLLPIAMVTLSTSGIASAAPPGPPERKDTKALRTPHSQHLQAANARAAMELLKYLPETIFAARNAGRPTA
jgi:hypothetical protein